MRGRKKKGSSYLSPRCACQKSPTLRALPNGRGGRKGGFPLCYIWPLVSRERHPQILLAVSIATTAEGAVFGKHWEVGVGELGFPWEPPERSRPLCMFGTLIFLYKATRFPSDLYFFSSPAEPSNHHRAMWTPLQALRITAELTSLLPGLDCSSLPLLPGRSNGAVSRDRLHLSSTCRSRLRIAFSVTPVTRSLLKGLGSAPPQPLEGNV